MAWIFRYTLAELCSCCKRHFLWSSAYFQVALVSLYLWVLSSCFLLPAWFWKHTVPSMNVYQDTWFLWEQWRWTEQPPFCTISGNFLSSVLLIRNGVYTKKSKCLEGRIFFFNGRCCFQGCLLWMVEEEERGVSHNWQKEMLWGNRKLQ